MNDFLNKIGLAITNAVSTMWCAIAFAVLALISLPSALATHNVNTIVAWVAQTFLQLVLLSIIMVGQKLQADTTIRHLVKHHEEHMGELAKLKKHLNIK